MTVPTVSIIVSARNAADSAQSIERQSIGRERLEVIVDNDRNAGLDRARGEFVLFLGSDDRLRPETLERMVRVAEENGTDVVLGETAGAGGRAALFRREPLKRQQEIEPHEIGVRHHVSRAELSGTRVRLAGYAYLHRVETHDVTTELVLRERETGTEYRLPVTHTASPGIGTDEDQGRYLYEKAGFEAAFDIDTVADGSPLDDGLWDISLAVGAQGLTREVRIGSSRAGRLSGRPDVRITETVRGRRAVTLYTTVPYGNYTIDLGERKHPVLKRVTFGGIRWHAGRPTELLLTGRCTLGACPRGALTVHLSSTEGATAVFPAVRPAHGEQFTVSVPVAELGPGVWSGELRLGERVLPLPPLPKGLTAAKWWRRSGLWYAKPASRAHSDGGFALRVGKTGKAGLLKAALGHVPGI